MEATWLREHSSVNPPSLFVPPTNEGNAGLWRAGNGANIPEEELSLSQSIQETEILGTQRGVRRRRKKKVWPQREGQNIYNEERFHTIVNTIIIYSSEIDFVMKEK